MCIDLLSRYLNANCEFADVLYEIVVDVMELVHSLCGFLNIQFDNKKVDEEIVTDKNVKIVKHKKNVINNSNVTTTTSEDGVFSDENLKLLASSVLCCASLFASLKVKTLKFLPVSFFFFLNILNNSYRIPTYK